MESVLCWIIFLSAPFVIFAHPHDILPRNITHPAFITSNVYSSNGSTGSNASHLISSFQTFLYVPPSTVALSSLTGRGIQPRLLYQCRSPTAMFHHSHCIHRSGQTGAMQRYIIYCRETNPASSEHSHSPQPLGETGTCHSKEICVDSWLGDRESGTSLARCVRQDAFKRMDSIDDDIEDAGQGRGQGQDRGTTPMDTGEDSEDDNSGHLGGEKRRKLDRGFVLGGHQASVVVSRADRSTPMGVDQMVLDAVGTEHSTKMCEDCSEMRTEKLAPGTDELNMQATVLAAGAGAAAGVIWVALFSG